MQGLQTDLMVFCLRIWLLSSLVQKKKKNLEAKLNSFVLMALANISKESTIDYVA